MWSIYDELISGIPDSVRVQDYVVGTNWSCVTADCGAGVSYTLTGGKKTKSAGDLRGAPLKEAAKLAKSWDFRQATIGVAALNAWYGRPEHLDEMGAKLEEPKATPLSSSSEELTEEQRSRRPRDVEAFAFWKPEVEGFQLANGRPARVVVVGHFPHVETMMEYCDLTVLERNCKNVVDTPDPACEYVLPDADFAFMTGVTLINKTMPRLLQIAKGARVAVVGPSAVASPVLFANGVELIAGRCVVDPDQAMFCCAAGEPFKSSLRSFVLEI
ncbi:MAG: DUF364 domain-containing protein [Eggerthellaceae bacterium]|nr:DUF364 domain-containing protein [Eggerthellaceae bacterium]